MKTTNAKWKNLQAPAKLKLILVKDNDSSLLNSFQHIACHVCDFVCTQQEPVYLEMLQLYKKKKEKEGC